MTNQEKKAYLQKYRAADDEINDLLREKERIMSRLTRMTSCLSGMPHGGGESDKMTNGVAKVIELEAEIDRKIDKLCDLRREVCANIGTVNDTTLRRVLMLRYISGKTWEQIAVTTNYCYMQVCRLHGKALTAMKM
jgi:DNA-directed RNA polymerase specialized sigma subunit